MENILSVREITIKHSGIYHNSLIFIKEFDLITILTIDRKPIQQFFIDDYNDFKRELIICGICKFESVIQNIWNNLN